MKKMQTDDACAFSALHITFRRIDSGSRCRESVYQRAVKPHVEDATDEWLAQSGWDPKRNSKIGTKGRRKPNRGNSPLTLRRDKGRKV